MKKKMAPYSGARWQQGHGGWGHLFKGLWRSARPLVSAAGKQIAKHGMKHGVGLAKDLLAGQNLKKAATGRLKNVLTESIQSAAGTSQPRKRPAGSGGIKARPAKQRAIRARRRHHGDIFG